MNKRITSILLCFIMVLSMLATAVPVLAAPTSTCTYTVEADKSEAHRGDTITYTVYLQQTGTQNSLEFTVRIPDGLSYVANSGVAPTDINATLNWTGIGEGAGWTEQSMLYNGFGAVSFTGTGKVKLLTFQCTVDDDAAFKNYNVELIDLVADDENYDTKNPVAVPASINVVAAPIAVTGVTVDKTLSLKTGESKILSYIVTPVDATNKIVSFKSGKPNVATVNETTGEVTGINEGTAIITITTADGNFTDTCVVTVACAHTNTTIHPANASTCLVQGNNEYTTCDDCGVVVSGSDGKLPLAEHKGGTATCENKAICSTCNQPYGSLSAHSYKVVVAAKYLKSAATCVASAEYYKSCEVCGIASITETFANGSVDATNHDGETFIENQKEATDVEDGYTGDIICNSCKKVIEYGEIIPAGGHNPANVWSTDSQYHWKECQTVGCGNIIDKAVHSGGEATCSAKAICEVCGVEYGEFKPSNHQGETEIRNAKEATCTENGYTGDVYCLDCGEKLSDGEETTLAHSYGDYVNDESKHWKECGCGNIIEEDEHTFGEWAVIKEATQTEMGIKEKTCSVCGYVSQEIIPVIAVEPDTSVPDTSDEETTVPDTSDEETTDSAIIDDEITDEEDMISGDVSEESTAAPTETESEKAEITEESKTPKTGEETSSIIWLAVGMVSIVGLSVVTVYKKKKVTDF